MHLLQWGSPRGLCLCQQCGMPQWAHSGRIESSTAHHLCTGTVPVALNKELQSIHPEEVGKKTGERMTGEKPG